MMPNSKLTKIFGYISGFFYLSGVFFKSYAMPTAGIQLLLGSFALTCFYLPLWLSTQLKGKKFLFFYWSQFIVLELFIIAFTSRVFHWEFADVFTLIFQIFAVVVFVPALLLRLYSKEAEKKDHSHTIVLLLLFASVFIMFNGARVSKSVLKSINSSQNRVEAGIEKLNIKSQHLYKSFQLLKDTSTNLEYKKAKELKTRTDSLSSQIQSTITNLIAVLDDIPLAEADTMRVADLVNKTNVEIPTALLLNDTGKYAATKLKQMINAYRNFVLSLADADQNKFLKEGINLNTADDYNQLNDEVITWEEAMFEHAPANIVLNNLLQLQAEVKNAETQLLAQLLNNAVAGDKTNLAIQIAELGVKYETEKKEQQLALLEKDKKLFDSELEAKQKAIESRNKTISIFVICIICFVVMLFYIVRSNLLRKQLNKELANQKAEVVQKNNEILDSIEYAKRIQTAILPQHKIVKQHLEQSFILYKPKDIVAGDFYWMENVGDLVLFAACDCTGHGVPGAMVSVVCNNALNRAVREFGLTQPAAILDKTAEIVIENFNKSEEEIKDGMDISLCAFHTHSRSIEWAGANNPLWIIRKGELLETKADKQSIGANEHRKPFTNHRFNLEMDDTIYMFTDGFADQFGGASGEKKLTKKRFRELLLTLQSDSMPEQGVKLEAYIAAFRNQVEQIDDILVIGVRV